MLKAAYRDEDGYGRIDDGHIIPKLFWGGGRRTLKQNIVPGESLHRFLTNQTLFATPSLYEKENIEFFHPSGFEELKMNNCLLV